MMKSLAVFAVAILAVNAGYGFHGTFQVAHGLPFKSDLFQALNRSWGAGLPNPFPDQYLLAFDRQLADAQQANPSFLFGHSYKGGRWYYFLALLAIKSPLPVLILAGLCVFNTMRGKGLRREDTLLLLLPAVLVFIVFSFLSDKQIGLRMILPSMTLFLIWMGATLASSNWSRLLCVTIGLLLVWLAVEVIHVHPNYLSYFNQIAGGPENGYRFAADSNLDWGQDLPGLRDYMRDKQIDRIQLLYFGRVDPEVYGIDYRVPFAGSERGYLAVSRSLYARGYFLNDHGALRWAGPFPVPTNNGITKIASIAHTIDIYRVP